MKARVSFLLLALATGCHTEPGQYFTTEIHPDLQTLMFARGSYWIYESDTGRSTDCMYVVSTVPGSYVQTLGLNRFGKTYYYDLGFFYTSTVHGEPADWQRITGNVILWDPVPCTYGSYCGPVIYDATGAFLDTLKVGDLTFFRVQKATIDSLDLFTSSSLGIVKRVLRFPDDTVTWNLVRWKLVY